MNSSERQRGRSLCVLVVDDDRDTAESLGLVLKLWGHAPQVALNGPSALALVRARWPDVAIIDMAMPRMDGLELAKQIRELAAGRRTPLLLAASGYGEHDFVQRCLQDGFDHHFIKPVDLVALRQCLQVMADAGPVKGDSP